MSYSDLIFSYAHCPKEFVGMHVYVGKVYFLKIMIMMVTDNCI